MKTAPFLLLLAAGFARTAFAADDQPFVLPSLVSAATRSPADPLFLGSAIDFIPASDLERRQISTLAGALGGLAGAPIAQSGAAGGTSSLFLRGANSNQTLFLVDGIRMNDPNTDYNVFLGGACIS